MSVSAIGTDRRPVAELPTIWLDRTIGESNFDLKGWIPKITKHEVGDNFGNTFRVENGLLEVRYDKYKGGFDGQFGHLFWKDPFSYYKILVEYRFVGQQAPNPPAGGASGGAPGADRVIGPSAAPECRRFCRIS